MTRIKSKYKPLYTSKKRYFILTGGRGSGKTFVVQDFLIRLLEEVGQNILYTRYTATSVDETIMPLFVEYLKLVSNVDKYHITKDKIINKATRAFIMFSGIKANSKDQTGKLKSLPNICTWVIEEGEDFNNEKIFTDIDDSIRTDEMQNRVIWIQNPTTFEHFVYGMFFEGNFHYEKVAKAGTYIDENGKEKDFVFQRCTHPDVEHIHTTYLDNLEHLNSDKVAKWENTKKTNPIKYQHKYIGGWLDKAEGVVLTNWKTGIFDTSIPAMYGMDFGFSNDPTTLVKVGVNWKHRKLFVKQMHYAKDKGTGDVVNICRTIKSNTLIIADSAEPRLISDVRKEGINITACIKGPDSIRAGIKLLQDFEIIVDPNSHDIIKEFNNYVWSDKKSNTPIDNFNHIIDAIRYVVFYQKHKIKTVRFNRR